MWREELRLQRGHGIGGGGGHPETSLKDRDQAVDGVDVRGELGVPEGDGDSRVR